MGRLLHVSSGSKVVQTQQLTMAIMLWKCVKMSVGPSILCDVSPSLFQMALEWGFDASCDETFGHWQRFIRDLSSSMPDSLQEHVSSSLIKCKADIRLGLNLWVALSTGLKYVTVKGSWRDLANFLLLPLNTSLINELTTRDQEPKKSWHQLDAWVNVLDSCIDAAKYESLSEPEVLRYFLDAFVNNPRLELTIT
jgi:hypothetical protein